MSDSKAGVFPVEWNRPLGCDAAWLRVAIIAPMLGVLLVALYWTILHDLVVQWWHDADYAHGFLVPLFSGFLIWRERDALRALTPRGHWLGLPLLLLGIGALLIGRLGSVNFLMRNSLIIILAGLVVFHLGTRVLRVVLFPLAFLLFMVPLPMILHYALTFPLQNLAARQAAWTLDLIGIPVILDGNVIHLSQISLGVTEACSGVRSLISLLAGAVAWAFLMRPTRWVMTVFVLATIPITIVANASRVVITGLIGQWFGAEYASGFFHAFSGWLIFVVALAGLFAVQGLLRLGGALRSLGRA
jgi:exosortase